MQKKIISLKIFVILFIYGCSNIAFAQQYMKITSSPNPVGSGAIALGMGGAYIAMAYDATAASWNPACLVRLDHPEFSLVFDKFCRTEDNTFKGSFSGASGPQQTSKADFNYLSFSYPIVLERNDHFRKLVFSVNYQRLYDFSREWNISQKTTPDPYSIVEEYQHYQQKGDISALGLACGFEVLPRKLCLGFTLNFWKDGLLGLPNKWEDTDHVWGATTFVNAPSSTPPQNFDYTIHQMYSFKDGFNFNIGGLLNWRGEDRFRIGAVLKSPFTASLTYNVTGDELESLPPPDEEVDMPMSYGIGFSWEPLDSFIIAADIYRTRWKEYVIRDSEGKEISPITGMSSEDSDIGDTTQVRIGAEYVWDRPEYIHAWTGRIGMFYDPIPDRKNPEDCYGLTVGVGFAKKLRSDDEKVKIKPKKYSIDVAYQYRFANDVSVSIFDDQDHYEFSQDIEEHVVYSSVIFYY